MFSSTHSMDSRGQLYGGQCIGVRLLGSKYGHRDRGKNYNHLGNHLIWYNIKPYILTYLRVRHMRQHRHMARQRRQTVFQQRRQRMIPIRRMPLPAQYRQQHVPNAGQWQTTASIRTAADIDQMQPAAAALHDARIASFDATAVVRIRSSLQTILVDVQRKYERRIQIRCTAGRLMLDRCLAFGESGVQIESGTFGRWCLQFGWTAQVIVTQITAGGFVGFCGRFELCGLEFSAKWHFLP